MIQEDFQTRQRLPNPQAEQIDFGPARWRVIDGHPNTRRGFLRGCLPDLDKGDLKRCPTPTHPGFIAVERQQGTPDFPATNLDFIPNLWRRRIGDGLGLERLLFCRDLLVLLVQEP